MNYENNIDTSNLPLIERLLRMDQGSCFEYLRVNKDKLVITEKVKWLPMETAPKDGTLILLKITEGFNMLDDSEFGRTIGFNLFDKNYNDEWLFSGWCWIHDHFTEGKGKPVGWMPYPIDEIKE